MFKHWKNITIYKLSREADLTDLEDKKKMILFTPCGSQDMAKFGFVSPFGDNSEVIAMHGNGFILVEAKRETKILPPPVIQRAIQEKIEKLEQEQARKLKKTEKDSLKDEVLHSLLPRAFSKFSVIQAIYDGSTKRIYINASARQAEDMLALMRKSLGSLPAVPLSVENPIELTLTDWVRDGSAPQGFQMGDAAELKAVLEDGGIARVKKQDLGSDEISTHLEAGKLVTKLALDWQNRIKFTLDHNFSLTSVKFADEFADIPPGMKSTKAVNAFRMAAFGEYIDNETASTVKARDFKDATDLAVFSSTGAGFWSEGHGTLRAREQESHEHLVTLAFPERMSGTQHAATKNTSPSLMAKNPTAVCYEVRNAEVAVRRLTPVECERLQGFPDGHTLIPTEKRKKVNSDELAYLRNHYPDLSEEEAAMLAADGPRYKAIGNSMAIPVMRWIGDRITKAVCRQKEGSKTKERKVKPAAEFERSIFKWAGGKFGVLEQIFRYLPEGKRLIEPFVGGGAVFMNAGYQENLLNDVNADLINFYKTLQREAHSLITLAHRFFQDYNTQEGYLAVRNAFNKQVYDDLHRAAAFLFLNRHCFNGLTRYNQAGEFNVGYGKYKTPYFPLQEMEAFLGAEGRSEFVCGDFAAVIEAAGEGDVIFCDPPYEPLPNTEGFTNYSGHDFKFEEQKRLVSLLTDAHRRGAKVLITNSGAPNIRELYHDSGFRVEPLFARRSVSCKGDTRGVAHDVLGILL